MSALENPLEIIRRRLAWRASRRGIREMDMLVGGFAEQRLATMNESQLTSFASILELPDQDIMAWVTCQAAVPAHLQSPLLMELLAFRPTQAKP